MVGMSEGELAGGGAAGLDELVLVDCGAGATGAADDGPGVGEMTGRSIPLSVSPTDRTTPAATPPRSVGPWTSSLCTSAN